MNFDIFYLLFLFAVVYLACTMALGTVSVCLTVLTLNLHHRDPERKVPRWAKVVVLNYMSKILCVRARRPRAIEERSLFGGNKDRSMFGGKRDKHADGINIRSGLRQIARDAHILRPMLNSNHTNCIDESKYNGGEHMFPSLTPNNQDQAAVVNSDWKELAHVLDRLFFWIVFMFMTASTMIILSVPLYKDVDKKFTHDSS